MNNEFNKEIIRLDFCLFVCLFLCSLSYFLSCEVIFFRRALQLSSNSFFFYSLVVISFILFFYLLEKTNLFFSFYHHFSLSIKKKYRVEMLLWILFMDRCLLVLHGIRFTFVVVEEQFFFSKMKNIFFSISNKNNHNNSFFFSFHTYTHTLTYIHYTAIIQLSIKKDIFLRIIVIFLISFTIHKKKEYFFHYQLEFV